MKLPGVCSSAETGPGDTFLSSLPRWASQALGLAEILVWGSHWVPQSEYCSWVERLLGTTAQMLQKAFLESDIITLGPLASRTWLGQVKAQTVPVSELEKTNTISISLTTMNARYLNEEYQEEIYKSQTGMCKFWGTVE